MITPEDLKLSEEAVLLGSYGLQMMWQMRQRAARAFEPLGFRTNRVLVLEFVALGCSQPKDLHEALGIVPPAISTIVAELERRGFLGRQIDPQDGRRVNLYLTPEGEAVREQLHQAWYEAHRETTSALTKKELAMSLEIYRKALAKPLF